MEGGGEYRRIMAWIGYQENLGWWVVYINRCGYLGFGYRRIGQGGNLPGGEIVRYGKLFQRGL